MSEISIKTDRFAIKEDGKEIFVIEDIFAEFVEINRKKDEMHKEGKTPADVVDWYRTRINDRHKILLDLGSVEELMYQIDLAWVKKNREREQALKSGL